MRTAIGRVVLATTCSLLVWSSPASGREDEAALKERVMKVYPQALKELETHFAKASGAGTCVVDQRVGTDAHFRIDSRVTFACNRPFLAKTVSLASRTTMKDKKTDPVREVVFCYNTENSFWLAKPAGDAEYIVNLIDTDKDERSRVRSQIRQTLRFLDAPYTAGGLRMSLAFARPNFSIRRVSALNEGDRNRLRIEFELKGGRGLTAWVVVAPDERWVIHEYEYKDFQDTRHGRIEYGEPIDGFPVPKRVRLTESSAGNLLATASYGFDVDQIHFGDVIERDFSLAAFGVKGQEGAKKQ
jgi:hypothetical protein